MKCLSVKRVISLVLAIGITILLLPAVSLGVNAYTIHTQDEAIAWLENLANTQTSLDMDGAYGAQCVDLIVAYYDYLGVPRTWGNAIDYSWNQLPDGWQRIQGGFPQAGDIVIYCASEANGYCGHIGIAAGEYGVYHQNVGGRRYVYKSAYMRYDGLGDAAYWGLIRPDFTTPAREYLKQCTSNPTTGVIRVTKDQSNINDRPCSRTTDETTVTLEKGPVGQEYAVTSIYKNTQGNYWYEIRTSAGQTGYIFSENCKFTLTCGDVALSGASIPVQLSQLDAFSPSGSVTASTSHLIQVSVDIYTASGTKMLGQSKNLSGQSGDLSGIQISTNALPVSTYRCVITAKAAGTKISGEALVSATKTLELYNGELKITCGNHNYGNWSVTQNTACLAEGSRSRSCRDCGYAETETIPATGHNWVLQSYAGTSCVDPGHEISVCTNCGETSTQQGQVTWSDWNTTAPEVDPDRLETRTQYRYRDMGGDWQVTETGTADYVPYWPYGFDTNNSYYAQYNGTAKVTSETETQRLTVTTDQVVGYLYYHWCRNSYAYGPINRMISDCYTDQFWAFHCFFSTEAAGHTDAAGTYVGDAFYCYAPGCCVDTYWYFQVPVHRQTYTVETKNGTGGEWGSWSEWSDTLAVETDTRQVQTRMVYRWVTGGLEDHSWDDGIRTKEPTRQEEGEITYTCTVCGGVKMEVLPKLNFRECSHDETVTENATAASCIAAGYSGDIFCADCEELLEAGSPIPATGHTEVTDAKVDATCTKPGKTVGKHCSVCNEVLVAQEEIPATDHRWDNGKVTKEPTATENGVKTYTCANCGETKTEVIPATGAEIVWGDASGDGKVNAMDATRILRYAAKLIKEDKIDLIAADVNSDGRVNAMDATRILRYAAKLIAELKVQK